MLDALYPEKTQAGWIVKLVSELLWESRVPMSTTTIQTQLNVIVRHRQIRQPGERIILLDLSDLPSMLSWMNRNKMISNHTFYNRKEQYWSCGLFVHYRYMND